MTTGQGRARVTRALGRWGEEAAAVHCQRLGWTIVERNWRCARGELDLVARQPDGTIVFIEVKCRSGLGFGDPLEAITVAKLSTLRGLASEWLRERDQHGSAVRLDAIGVLRARDGLQVSHVRGIVR